MEEAPLSGRSEARPEIEHAFSFHEFRRKERGVLFFDRLPGYRAELPVLPVVVFVKTRMFVERGNSGLVHVRLFNGQEGDERRCGVDDFHA